MSTRSTESHRREQLTNGPMQRAAQHGIAENARGLAKAPRILSDALGTMWNAPNEAIGWTVGGVGSVLGSAGFALGLWRPMATCPLYVRSLIRRNFVTGHGDRPRGRGVCRNRLGI